MRELLSELTAALDRGRACVYCTVVETRGSTPQKAGASMLVFADGAQFGTLGGGCVEAEVKCQALRVIGEGGAPRLMSFALDDNYGWDDGLICGGKMTVLADPIPASDSPAADFHRHLHRLVAADEGCLQAVLLKETAGIGAGGRFLFNVQGRLVAQRADGGPPEPLLQNLPRLDERPRPATIQGVAFLPVLPRIRLLIVGGGHVGQAVGELAAAADFEVWVLDDREIYASPERFPSSTRRIVGPIGPTLKELVDGGAVTPSTYCIIVTRGHNHDEEALYHLATTKAGYVGMIGSKRKIRLIFEDLVSQNIPEKALDRVHAPLGLPIGSQTVPEIAVSIVAELIARRNLGPSACTPKR